MIPIQLRVKMILQSSDFQTFEIANALLSEKLKVVAYKENTMHCLTPKRRSLLVIFIEDENKVKLEFQNNKKKTLQEIRKITHTTKQKSLESYARVCRAKDGKDLMEWCLKNPSEEIRLHVWELLKADPHKPIQMENISFEQY